MRRVGKALLHLWHTEGHIGRREFTRKIFTFGAISFLLNLSLVFSFYQSDRTGLFQQATLILWAMLIANLILVFIFTRIVGKRINDVRGHVSVFKGGLYTLCTALPYAGLYLIIFLCRRKGRVTEQHHQVKREWSLFQHTLIAIILPLLVFAPIRYNAISKKIIDLNVPVGINLLYATFYDVSDPALRYVLRLSRTSINSDLIIEHCQKNLSASCLEYSKVSLNEGTGDTTEVALQISANALHVFKRKDASFYSSSKEENNIMAVLELLRSNVEIIKFLDMRVDQFESAFPFAVYLLSGNIQVPLLELLDRTMLKNFLKVSLKVLVKLHQDTRKVLANAQNMSDEKLKQFEEQFEVLDRELEFLTTRYDTILLEK